MYGVGSPASTCSACALSLSKTSAVARVSTEVKGREGERFHSPDMQLDRIKESVDRAGGTYVDFRYDPDKPSTRRTSCGRLERGRGVAESAIEAAEPPGEVWDQIEKGGEGL